MDESQGASACLVAGNLVKSTHQKHLAKMNLDALVAILCYVAPRPVTRVQGVVEAEEGVSVTEIRARQTVPIVLRHIAGRGEQVDLTLDVPQVGKFWLKWFGGHRPSAMKSMQHNTRGFGRCRETHFHACATWSLVRHGPLCDMVPCGMECILQWMGANGI